MGALKRKHKYCGVETKIRSKSQRREANLNDKEKKKAKNVKGESLGDVKYLLWFGRKQESRESRRQIIQQRLKKGNERISVDNFHKRKQYPPVSG